MQSKQTNGKHHPHAEELLSLSRTPRRMRVGTVVQLARQQRGMTQTELASKLDMESRTLQRYEANELIPDDPLALRLSELLRLQTDRLIHLCEIARGIHLYTINKAFWEIASKYQHPSTALLDRSDKLNIQSDTSIQDKVRNASSFYTVCSLGNLIHLTRKQRGLSKQTLADLVGIGHRTLTRFERDEIIPDDWTAYHLAEALSLRTDYVLVLCEISRGIDHLTVD